MAKKTIKTKAKAKPKTKVKAKVKSQAKPRVVKAVVKKEPVARVINKPQPGKTEKKEKISKILLFVSLGLILGVFLSLLAPAATLKFFGDTADTKMLGTGIITSLLTYMLYLPCKVICYSSNGSILIEDTYAMRPFGRKNGLPCFIQFIIIVVLLVLAITILILLLTKKYKGLVKLILSIVLWTLLILVVGSMFLEVEKFISVTSKGEFTGITIKETGFGLAPILCIALGGCSLGTSVASFVLNRK